ncbi:MBL fold metallo-hydrolase [Pseudonocardia broussonetiae]|uniref:MBL fold metallo-hydrolase n=1 Tax=Pseudonocardia broussonetiae TaxID=2736640 RepID=UPI0015557416|nr:MBL fold metallo-hydrolase [Pseudonocardia broussonetiae]
MDVLDNYSGHTDPGGPAARRELDALTITKLSVGPMDNNAFLLVCRATGEALLLDAANDAERLADLIGSGATRPELRTLVTSHRHADHWQALGAVAGMFQPHLIAHPIDAPELPIPMDELVEHGDVIRFGQIELEVIHLRGHTQGSIALLYRGSDHPHLFSADSLFPGGPGRTWSEPDFWSLVADLEARVFDVLPDDTWVYPGHGDDTTLGKERPSIPDWKARGWVDES